MFNKTPFFEGFCNWFSNGLWDQIVIFAGKPGGPVPHGTGAPRVRSCRGDIDPRRDCKSGGPCYSFPAAERVVGTGKLGQVSAHSARSGARGGGRQQPFGARKPNR